MKYILTILGLVAALSANAVEFKVQSFLAPHVLGPYSVTNAACASCFTQATYAGISITNAASGSLGGLTNLLSWNNSTTAPINQATNSIPLSWTNNLGIWERPTNGVAGAGVSGFITWKQGPDRTVLLQDIDIPVMPSGGIPVVVPTNNWDGTVTSYPLSPFSLSVRLFGDTGAGFGGGNMNFFFVGLPDGVNEVPSVAGDTGPRFTWGVPQIVGNNVATTNFPIWKFVGCKKIRLQCAFLANTSSNNATMTIQSLTFNGPVP